VKTKIQAETLAGFIFEYILIILFALAVFGVVGGVMAYVWNTFVVPNVAADLPILLWWQAALGVLALRMLVGIIRN